MPLSFLYYYWLSFSWLATGVYHLTMHVRFNQDIGQPLTCQSDVLPDIGNFGASLLGGVPHGRDTLGAVSAGRHKMPSRAPGSRGKRTCSWPQQRQMHVVIVLTTISTSVPNMASPSRISPVNTLPSTFTTWLLALILKEPTYFLCGVAGDSQPRPCNSVSQSCVCIATLSSSSTSVLIILSVVASLCRGRPSETPETGGLLPHYHKLPWIPSDEECPATPQRRIAP
jgi:hypothetical protein